MRNVLACLLVLSMAASASAQCEWRNGRQYCKPTPARQGWRAPARQARAQAKAEESVVVESGGSYGSTSYGSAGSTSYEAPAVSYGSAGSTSYEAPAAVTKTVTRTRQVRAVRPVRRVGAGAVRVGARLGRGIVRAATAPVRILKKGVQRRRSRRCAS